MSVKVATGELLLDALIEDERIKAAVLVDARGYVVERRGDARSLKGKDHRSEPTESSNSAGEHLYLVAAGEQFLVVVFEETTSFERLKSFVDGQLGEFGMALQLDE